MDLQSLDTEKVFAVFGHREGVAVKLMDGSSPEIKGFKFETLDYGGKEDGSKETVEKDWNASCEDTSEKD